MSMMKRKSTPLTSRQSGVLALVFVLMSAGAFAGIYAFGQSQQAFIEAANTTTGTVTSLLRSRSSSGNTLYTPVIEFVAEPEQAIEFHPNISEFPSRWQVGDQVSVYYDPQNPSNAMLAEHTSFFGHPLNLILLIFGGISLIIGVGMMFLTRHLERGGTL